MYKRLRGFTLIELLVVIAIIGILASIVMVSLGGAKAKSRDSRRVADIKNIQLALSLYYNDNLMYPKNIYANSTGASAPNNGLTGGYLPVVPQDPSGASCTTATGSGAGCYVYTTYSNTNGGGTCNGTSYIPVMYHIGATLEDTNSAALSQDVDASLAYFTTSPLTLYGCTTSSPGPLFDGNATNCIGTSASSPDTCYDWRP